MFVRNLNLKGVSVETTIDCLNRLLKSRRLVVTSSSVGDVLEIFGFTSASWLVQSSCEIKVAQVDEMVEVRIELHTSVSVVGAILGLVALILSIPFFGLLFGIFLILYDHSASRVIHELDVFVDEIYKKIEVIAKNGSKSHNLNASGVAS